MKILKIIGGLIAFAVVAFLVTGLFVKKEYAVVCSTVIQKPKNEVFDYVVLLKNQDNYSVWAKMDPNAINTYEGTDGKTGFTMKWTSENPDVGSGEQEIVNISYGDRIDYALRFKAPFESESDSYMATESVSDNETRVSWSVSGDMPYPM
ncbi:MAG: SRPBCC family protein, partial [Bacteroidota bacterium]